MKTLFLAWLDKNPFERPDHATLVRFLEHIPFWTGAAGTVCRRPSRGGAASNNPGKADEEEEEEEPVLPEELLGLLSGLAPNGEGARRGSAQAGKKWWKREGRNWWEIAPDIKPVERREDW